MRQVVRVLRDARAASCLAGALALGCAETPASSVADGDAASVVGVAPSAASAPALFQGGIVADVEVRDGSGVQRYHVETVRGTCVRRTSGPGSWAIRFAGGGARPWTAELNIPSAVTAEHGTDVFALRLEFSSAGGATLHEVDGSPARSAASGGGRATVLDHGSTATIVAEGLTAGGVRVGAVIRCRMVARIAGPDAG